MKTIKLEEKDYNSLINFLKEDLKSSEYRLSEWESDYETLNEYKRQSKTKEKIVERYEYFTNRTNQLKNLINNLEISE